MGGGLRFTELRVKHIISFSVSWTIYQLISLKYVYSTQIMLSYPILLDHAIFLKLTSFVYIYLFLKYCLYCNALSLPNYMWTKDLAVNIK